jgi:hypothetical protein
VEEDEPVNLNFFGHELRGDWANGQPLRIALQALAEVDASVDDLEA